MATRTTVRDTTIALQKAATAVSALVSDRVYDERHADYPSTSPHPAIIVYTPTTNSTPRDLSQAYWEVDDELVLQLLLKREPSEEDAALSARADTLEHAVRAAALTSQAWRDLCEIESVSKVRIERIIGSGTDAHRMAVKLTFTLQRPDEFEQSDSEVTLDEIIVHLHPKDEDTGLIPDDPTSSRLVD